MKEKPGETEADKEELQQELQEEEEDEEELEEEAEEEEEQPPIHLPPSRPKSAPTSMRDGRELQRLYQTMIQHQQTMNQMLELQQKRIEQIATNQSGILTSLEAELRQQIGHRQRGEAFYEMLAEALAQQSQHLDRLQTTAAALIAHHRQDHQA